MPNVGGGEILLVLLVALMVLGPAKLPAAIRQVGRVVGEIRRVGAGFQQELREAAEPVTQTVSAIKAADPAKAVTETISAAEPAKAVTETVGETKGAFDDSAIKRSTDIPEPMAEGEMTTGQADEDEMALEQASEDEMTPGQTAEDDSAGD